MVAELPSRADFCWDGQLDGKFQKEKVGAKCLGEYARYIPTYR